jgi:hypothetical protein
MEGLDHDEATGFGLMERLTRQPFLSYIATYQGGFSLSSFPVTDSVAASSPRWDSSLGTEP